MDYPINTPHDDLSFMMNPDGKSGYLSSDRSGVDRIYTFFLNDPVFMLSGEVTDDSTGKYLPQAEATLTNLITDEEVSMTTGSDGTFSFKLAQNTPYEVRVERNGMLTQSRVVTTEGLTDSRSVRAQFRLQPFQLNKTFALKNIYFDYDKWDIRPDAAIELDKLVRFINDNPTLVFELSSHTDSRGDDMYNLVLSDARANSTVDYLIRHGVPADRVLAHGYGETMLVNHCSNGVKCSEEEHQANRRTEIKILRKDVASATP
jgi:outer membrane protein OmpA-like peptidoglycan-associated protein